MTFSRERLYELLPAFDRVRDQESGRALEALLGVIAESVAALEEDLAQLYDDQFIETCAEWVVPYIGDLIGYRMLRGPAAAIRSPRAEVANTIGFRRRKGTAAMLEQLARDITGWNARVVEFFRLVSWAQHMRHLRTDARVFITLRSGLALEQLGGAFDPFPHTVDVRRIVSGRGRHNIPNVGVFLWRLGAFPVTDIPATPVEGDPLRYRFSPLGNDTQLFNAPETEVDVTHLAEQVNVPGPLSRRELAAHLDDYWDRALGVSADGTAVAAPQVQVCNLDDDPDTPGAWAHMPDNTIAVDPVLGRLAFPPAQQPGGVRVRYHSVFSAPMGGGEYEREASFDETLRSDRSARLVVVPRDEPTIAAALASLGAGSGVVEVATSDPQQLGGVALAAGQRVELRAGNGHRPLLALAGDVAVQGGADAELLLNGFLVAGGALLIGGRLRRATIRHCTLVPGHALTADGHPVRPGAPSVVVEPDPAALLVTLEIDQSITGPLRLAADVCELVTGGSIVDAAAVPRGSRVRLLLTGALAPFPTLSSPAPRVRITVGDDGPHQIVLPAVPTGRPEAATALQAAIRSLGLGPAFAEATVSVVGTRLAVLAGTGERVAIEAADGDPTASELKLDPAGSRRTAGLLGAPLPDPPPLTAAAPEWLLRIGAQEATVGGLTPNPSSLEALRGDLQLRIRAAATDPTFANALVGRVDDRLLVIPGTEELVLGAGASGADAVTVAELGLSLRPAIGSGATGAEPGAAATIRRSTIIGPVFVRELQLASESIFVDPVLTLRRQAGCVRFSYLPPSSQTPRRHRCQPESPREANRIRPAFTTLRYGLGAYGQLGPSVPGEIAAGAEDEAEMGAFHDLQQQQRLTNLRVRLDEYLRFGLEAGVVFAS
jgi:hypothetical protein